MLFEMPDLFAGLSGKTFQDVLAPTTTPSDVSWQDLQAQTLPCVRHLNEDGGLTQVWFPGHGHGSHGGFSMLNTTDSHNGAVACSLSQVLEKTQIPQRYFLSADACIGILRRAEKRGRLLPRSLQLALERVALMTTKPKQDTSSPTRSEPKDSTPAKTEPDGEFRLSQAPMAAATRKGRSRSQQPSAPRGGVGRMDFESETLVAFSRQDFGSYRDDPPTLRAKGGDTGGGGDKPHAMTESGVRRLTPRECERLQGFNDNYTLIPMGRRTSSRIDADYADYIRRSHPGLSNEEISRLAADGPRYRALGNSMAVPCMGWLGMRLECQEAKTSPHTATQTAEDAPPPVADSPGKRPPALKFGRSGWGLKLVSDHNVLRSQK